MAPEVRAAFDAGVDALRAAGTTIETGTIDGTDVITKTYVDIVLPEAAQWHAGTSTLAGRATRRPCSRASRAAATIPAVDYLSARETQRRLRRAVDAALDGCDALVLPTLPDHRAAHRIDRRRARTERPGAQRARGDAPQHAALQSDRPSGDLAAAAARPAAGRPAARRPARRDGAALGDRRRLARRSSVRRSSDAMAKQVSVTEAHALQQQGGTYVDVRSTPEFADGPSRRRRQRAAASSPTKTPGR